MQDLRNKNNDSLNNANKISKDASMLSSEESALKKRKRKNTLITILALLIFCYLSYKFVFKSNETKDLEKVVLPELETHNLISHVPISDLKIPPNTSSKSQNETEPKESDDADPSNTNADKDLVKEKIQPEKPEQEKVEIIDKTKKSKNSESTEEQKNLFHIEKVKYTEDELANIEARKESKKKSSIILISGIQQEPDKRSEPNNAQIKKSFDLNRTISKGKIIDVVVEHSINTDYGGEIRAVISGNIFSEWGKTILIPQGSKIFGTYAKGVTDHTGRIFITWNRIDLPNGYQINFDGHAMDDLGIKGVVGEYDRKIKEQFTNAVLLSAFDIAVAYGLDKIIPPIQSSTQAANANLQVTVARNAIDNISSRQNNESYQNKMNETCNQVRRAIEDKKSTAYKNIDEKICAFSLDTSYTWEAYQTFKSQLNEELNNLLIVNNSNTEETQAQKAARDAYEDITDAAKSLLFESQHWEPTVTIAQGAKIKIYTRQDYEFPVQAVYNKKQVKFIK